jgi:hypothetical protein
MDAVNSAMAGFFDLLWAPFSALPEWVGILVLGALFGVIALLAMKWTTNAKRVAVFKDRCMGNIIAILLFRDSLVVVFSSLGKTLGWLGGYVAEQFKPMFVMLIPFVLLFAQMQMRLGIRPLDVGAVVEMRAELDIAGGDGRDLTVELPKGLELRSRIVHQPARGHVAFKVAATEPGVHQVKFSTGGETVTKSVHVGPDDGTPMVTPVRSNSFFDQLLYPGESSFGGESRFERIAVTAYPVRPLPCFGFDLSFGSEAGLIGVFVVLTIVAAFGLKGVFGVTI